MNSRDLQDVLDAVLDGVIVVDDGGSVLRVNSEACRILETSAETATGEPLARLLGPDHAVSALAAQVGAERRAAIVDDLRIERRYGPDVLQWLVGIQLSQQAGFTVAEIKHLFYGFSRSAKPSERWKVLAREKLVEVAELIRRARMMKQLLEEGVRCGCTSLRECTLLARGSEQPKGVKSQGP